MYQSGWYPALKVNAEFFLSHAEDGIRAFHVPGVQTCALPISAPKDLHAQRTMVLNPLQDYYVVTNHGAVQKLITALTAIVIFILLLAIANFINISIAGS